MHDNFPHIKYGEARDQGLFIEYPPEKICSQEEWKDILDEVLLPEWENFDPEIKRKYKIIVRFVPKLHDERKNLDSSGCFNTVENELPAAYAAGLL